MIVVGAAAALLSVLLLSRKAYAGDPKERQWFTPALDPQHADKPKVEGWAQEKVVEKLSRGLVGKAVDGDKVYLSWRLLDSDPEDVGFDVYRENSAGQVEKLNQSPITATTDFTDTNPLKGKAKYWVQPVLGEQALAASDAVEVDSEDTELHYRSIKFQGDYMPSKIAVADLDGDGNYDFVIKQPFSSIDPAGRPNETGLTYKLEAYLSDGTFLWRKDLGLGIEPGIWYSPYVVYDFDGDGRAEVAVKTGPNHRDPDGRVREGEEWVSILDGMTGEELARAPWPPREPGYGDYNRTNRNQMGVAYLDGKTPCLLVARGTYKLMVVDAYQFHDGKLEKVWHWRGDDETPVIRSQGAHFMISADVDEDGRDEVILGSCVLDDNGTCLWSVGLGHPDRMYVSDIIPDREGMEIFYGIEPWHDDGNGICLVDAKTGRMLWNFGQPTKHIGNAMIADIDPNNPGLELWATEDSKAGSDAKYMFSSDGKLIATNDDVPPCRHLVWWDGDLIREFVVTNRPENHADRWDVSKWESMVVKYKGETLMEGIKGAVSFTADIFGDWREEIISVLPGEMRIYTPTTPAQDRRVTLMQDPIYRNTVAHLSMGYHQSPVPGYYLGEDPNKKNKEDE